MLFRWPRDKAPYGEPPQQAPLNTIGKVVREWTDKVGLNREPAIGRLHPVGLADPADLGRKPFLVFIVPEVLDHRVREHDVIVRFAIRKVSPISLHVCELRGWGLSKVWEVNVEARYRIPARHVQVTDDPRSP